MSGFQSMLQTLANQAYTSGFLSLINVFQQKAHKLNPPHHSTFLWVCSSFSEGMGKAGWVANTFQTLKHSFLHLQPKADPISAVLPLFPLCWWQQQPLWCPSPHPTIAFSLWKQWRLQSFIFYWWKNKGNFLYGMGREGPRAYFTGYSFLKNECWVYWFACKTGGEPSSELSIELRSRRQTTVEEENFFVKEL